MSDMHGELDKLKNFISGRFVFDEATYPELKNSTDEQKLIFALRHVALHFSKTAGKIGAVSESVDHGDAIAVEELKINIPKALINTLRLAELVGMSEQEILQAIEEKYSDTSS